MPKEDRRLGKGLAALLGENLEAAEAGTDTAIPLAAIRPNPFQPRDEFDPTALRDLAQSIAANGLLQPIVVRPSGAEFEIVAGERRFRAIESLGWESVSVVVRTLSDEEMLVVALVENLQRENLSALEEARGYQQLIDEFGMTQEEVGRHVGRDRSTVSNALRLLGLPESVQLLLAAGKLAAGHARALLGLEEEADQIAWARQAAAEGWSVRETERRVRGDRPATPKPRSSSTSTKPSPAADAVIRRAELVLERGLGTQVRIRTRSGDGGDVSITFQDSDDFMRLVELMVGPDAASELRG